MLVTLAFAVAFGALTAAVVTPGSGVRRFDDRALAALIRLRRREIDSVVGPVSTLATQEPLTLQALVAFALIAVTLGRAGALRFVVAAVGSGVLNEAAKRLVARARPAGPHLIPWFRGYAYPSGDVLTATAIYGTIALLAWPHMPTAAARAALAAIVPGLLAAVAFARVYVGVHHPSDVVAGFLLGAAWAAGVHAWFA